MGAWPRQAPHRILLTRDRISSPDMPGRRRRSTSRWRVSSAEWRRSSPSRAPSPLAFDNSSELSRPPRARDSRHLATPTASTGAGKRWHVQWSSLCALRRRRYASVSMLQRLPKAPTPASAPPFPAAARHCRHARQGEQSVVGSVSTRQTGESLCRYRSLGSRGTGRLDDAMVVSR